MWKIYLRTGLLGGAFAAGMSLPQAAPAARLVPYLIMLMLGVLFLRRGFSRSCVKPLHGVLLVVSPVLAFATWGILHLAGASPDLAAAGFYIAFTPTAAAAPVIMGMLDGDVQFTACATILSNLAAALAFPLVLTALNGEFHGGILLASSARVAQMILLPAVIAAVLRKYWSGAEAFGTRAGKWTFYLWTSSLFLLSAKAGLFLRESHQTFRILAEMAALSGILCAVQFALGRAIGKRFGMPREGGQCLGQKNTSLTIYLAMTYTSPAAALGPVFYIFFHNFWNACQLHRHSRELQKKGETP